MVVPDSLANRIQLFRDSARVFSVREDLFKENSWVQVMLGQGILPSQYHPIVDVMSEDELTRFMQDIKSRAHKIAANLPLHQAYVEQYCKAKTG